VEISTVVCIDLSTYLLKSRNVILFRLSATGLACRIGIPSLGIPDRMKMPRTKNGLLASLMPEARERLFGWYGNTARDLVDVEGEGHGRGCPPPDPTRGL